MSKVGGEISNVLEISCDTVDSDCLLFLFSSTGFISSFNKALDSSFFSRASASETIGYSPKLTVPSS